MFALAFSLALAPVGDPRTQLNPRQAAEKYLAAALADKPEEAIKFAVPEKAAADPAEVRKLKVFDATKIALPTVVASDKKGYALAVSEEIKFPQKKPTDPARGVLIVKLQKNKDGVWQVRDLDARPAEEAAKRVKEAKEVFEDAKELPPMKS